MAKLLVLFSAGAGYSGLAHTNSAPELDGKLHELDDIAQAAKGECDFHG